MRRNQSERLAEQYRTRQQARQREKNAMLAMATTNALTAGMLVTTSGYATTTASPAYVTMQPITYNTPAYLALADSDVERIAVKVLDLLAGQPEGDVEAALRKWRKEHIG